MFIDNISVLPLYLR